MYNPHDFQGVSARSFLREMYAATDEDGILQIQFNDQTTEYYRMSWDEEKLEQFIFRFEILRAKLFRLGQTVFQYGGMDDTTLVMLDISMANLWHFFNMDDIFESMSLRTMSIMRQYSLHKPPHPRHQALVDEVIEKLNNSPRYNLPHSVIHPCRFLVRGRQYMHLAAANTPAALLENEAILLARELALYWFCTAIL